MPEETHNEAPLPTEGAPVPAPFPTASEQVAAHHLDAGHHHGHAQLPPFKFLDELKRRNVGRVAILYIVVSYVVLEVFEMFFHLLEMPPWTGRAAVLLAVLGFPIALLIAWAYEITPEGLKPTDEVPAKQSIRAHTGKRLDRATIVVLAVALTYFVVDKFWLSKRSAPVAAEVETALAVAGAADKSIAVLPFTDMSEKKDQEYFADGMASEIIDLLASVPALRVIGSASSFRFRSTSTGVSEIARSLNVTYIAQGSVSRSGTRLRVTGRLIDGRDGRQVWSASYDREGSEILAVQADLAQAFARGLELATDAGAVAAASASGTRRPDAYDEYLRARHAYDRFDQEGMQQAAAHLARAIELDPTFVRAIELLALVEDCQAEWGFVPATEGFARASETSARALQLNPNSVWGHLVRLRVAMLRDFQWDIAERESQEALRLAPHDPIVLVTGASLASAMGRRNEAIRLGLESLVSDPLYPVGYIVLGWTYYRAGMLDKAENAFRRVLQLSPNYVAARLYLSEVLLAQGRFGEALAVAKEETENGGRDEVLAMAYFALGRKSDSNEALARLIRTGWDFGVAKVYAYRGQKDSAISSLEKAYANRDSDLYLIKGELTLRKIESDARYKAFLRKMNLPD